MIGVGKKVLKNSGSRSYSHFVNDDFILLISCVNLEVQHLSCHTWILRLHKLLDMIVRET